MDELKYLSHVPVTYRIKARHLEIGMFHVAKYESSSYEIARIRDVRVISKDSIQIDLGPVGHANRTVGLDQYVNVPVLHCPKCFEDTELSTDLHPGTAFVSCIKCGQRGPEFLPRGDDQQLLARVIRAWNNIPR